MHTAEAVKICEELERDLPHGPRRWRPHRRLVGADLVLEDRRSLDELRQEILDVVAGSAFHLQRLRPTPAARVADPAAVRYRLRLMVASPGLALSWATLVDLQHRLARRTFVCSVRAVFHSAG